MHITIATLRNGPGGTKVFVIGMDKIVKRWADKHGVTILESTYISSDYQLRVVFGEPRDYTMFALTADQVLKNYPWRFDDDFDWSINEDSV